MIIILYVIAIRRSAKSTLPWENSESTMWIWTRRTLAGLTVVSPLPRSLLISTPVSLYSTYYYYHNKKLEIRTVFIAPRTFLLALLACFLFYVVLAFLWIGVRAVLRRGYFDGCLCALKFKKRQKKKTSVEGNENPGGLAAPSTIVTAADEIAPKKKSSRLKSLDTFRGWVDKDGSPSLWRKPPKCFG